MRLFLTGATGYIGSVVAEELQAAGHTVLGLARSDEAAQKLRAKNIEAIHGGLGDADAIRQAVHQVDGVIHTASTNGPDAPQADNAAIDAIVSALRGTNKPFLYTSGVWVLGNTGETIGDESSPIRSVPLVAWRPLVEQKVLEAAKDGVRAVVIRPGVVYGRGPVSIVGQLVQQGRDTGVIKVVGSGENRWALVQVDDLAKLYVLALEHAEPGVVLNAVTGRGTRVRDIAEAIGQRLGGVPVQPWPLSEAQAVLGPFADALALDQQISDSKSRALGWQPQHDSSPQDVAAEAVNS